MNENSSARNYSKQLWILIGQNLRQGLISLAAKIKCPVPPIQKIVLPEKLLQITEVKAA